MSDHSDKHVQRSGFSMLELSIVLLILGLLAGGILAGRNLIRASEIRSVTTEFQRYHAGIHSFWSKYAALPGDMHNATYFWNRLDSNANCVTNSSTSVDVPGTCDGNANGIIEAGSSSSQPGELFTFWQQLSHADYIDGEYSGIAGNGSSSHAIPKVNAPASRTGGTWSVLTENYSGNTIFSDENYSNRLVFGAATATGVSSEPILATDEAWNIDQKIDDGMPGKGLVWAIHWDSCTTASASSDTSGEYLLTDPEIRCALVFNTGF